MEEKYQIAAQLLTPIWKAISADYKAKYARNIWQQFEDNVRAAAYTQNLSKFYSRLCSRLGTEIQSADVEAVRDVLALGRDRELLRLMRDEAATVVLLVRVENEKRKAEWQTARAEQERERLEIEAEGADEAGIPLFDRED